MTDLVEKNLQQQIEIVKSQIRQCNDDEFDSLIYKYNIFNNIKNTITEEILEIENFKDRLESDNKILEKIYNRFLNVNIDFLPSTFDEVMLDTFLIKEQEREEKLINIFKEEYIAFPDDKGMLPSNATALQEYSLQEINLLVDRGILQKRNCTGLAFEFTEEYIDNLNELEQENEEQLEE